MIGELLLLIFSVYIFS